MTNTYQLFFGRNIPNGGRVTDRLFESFLNTVDGIVDGYTVMDADGVWKGEHEDCKVMYVCCEPDKCYEIARLYRNTFNQEAVGVVTLPTMEFV